MSRPPTNRRRFLAVAGSLAASLGGCLRLQSTQAETPDETTGSTNTARTVVVTRSATATDAPSATDGPTAEPTDEPTDEPTEEPAETTEEPPDSTPSTAVTGWRSVGNDPGNAGVAVTGPDGQPDWQWRTSTTGFTAPLVAGDTVVAATEDGTVYAFAATNGRRKWSTSLDGQLADTPAIGDDTVYVADRDGGVYALALADGSRRWRNSYDGVPAIYSSPTVYGNLCYVTGSGTLLVIDADGTEVARATSETGQDFQSAPAVTEDAVYVGGFDGVYAWNRGTGTRRWRFSPNDARIFDRVAVAGDTVYATNENGALYAIDAVSGSVRWTHRTDRTFNTGPTATDDTVYAISNPVDGDKIAHAVDDADGTERWTYTLGDVGLFTPTVAGDVVYASHHALDATDGTELGTLPDVFRAGQTAISDGRIYAENGGNIVAWY
jgi:outer membrane protein assembly factor BamB